MGQHGQHSASRRHEAARRHRARRRTWIGTTLTGLLALVLLAGLLTATFLMRPDDREAGARDAPCPDSELVVAAVPPVAEVLSAAIASTGCRTVTVESRPTSEVVQGLLSGELEGEDVPDAWIPDSRLDLAPLEAATVRTPEVLRPSLATTPVVLASAEGAEPEAWRAVLDPVRSVPGDPMTDSATTAAFLAARAEMERAGMEQDQVVASVVPIAQSGAGTPVATRRLARVAERGGQWSTPVTEQAALAAGTEASLSVPDGRTVVLDHPVVLTSEVSAIASEQLARLLDTDDVAERLAAAGFRTREAPRPRGGVGEVTALATQAADVDRLRSLWSTLSVPTRALAVIDVSGSMGFEAGDATRIGLAVATTRSGLELFPGSASIGLWAFSHRLEGEQDHRTLVPVRRLDAEVGGSSQRELLAGALAGLPELVDGATGLHDTVLAAYRAATRDHDPDAVNTVLLFTDGGNEDPGSIGEAELLQQLRGLRDPERPVRVIAIGISDDADAGVLDRIAAATGGTAFVARRPQDISEVFRAALGARVDE